jgi:ribosomal protein S18 acetylase RimI-like enzyme
VDFTLRRAQPDDIEGLLPLIEAYQDFYEVDPIDPELNREFFSRFLDSDDVGWIYVAESGDGLLGFACFYRHKSSLSATDTVLMNDLYVIESARGGGVGRALIDQGLELARESGASCLEWSTAPDNATAQRLYDTFPAEKSTWLTYELPT